MHLKTIFLREIIIHNEFSSPTVYDMLLFEDSVCFTMCAFVNFAHFGPFSGSEKTKIGLCTPKYSFSGHVSVEVIVQSEISDPTMYNMSIFGKVENARYKAYLPKIAKSPKRL